MIIWTIKLLSTVRRAIAGRKYPGQLAWAVAFGLLLGIVPHGNLLALGMLILVLSLKINHAMAALTAIGTSFAATYLDPYSHQLGQSLLSDPQFSEVAVKAWTLPLVPWTQLNNTVVLGSLLIGVASLLPVFLITYPLFRMFAPKTDPQPRDAEESVVTFEEIESPRHQIVVVDQGQCQIAKPHPSAAPARTDASNIDADEPSGSTEGLSSTGRDVAIETRIDVIRMKDYRDPNASQDSNSDTAGEQTDSQQPMDEALSYLLRQLRDSQQRKVA
jgi:uncharacterized protein (TIGR03546 family)